MNLRHVPRLSVLRRFFNPDKWCHMKEKSHPPRRSVNLFSADREMTLAKLASVVASQARNDAFQAARGRRLRIL